jgi:hypothetical protein
MTASEAAAKDVVQDVSIALPEALRAYYGRETATRAPTAPGCAASTRSRRRRATAAGGPGPPAAATRGRRAPSGERGGARAACRRRAGGGERGAARRGNQGKAGTPADQGNRRGRCHPTASGPVSGTCRTRAPAGGGNRRAPSRASADRHAQAGGDAGVNSGAGDEEQPRCTLPAEHRLGERADRDGHRGCPGSLPGVFRRPVRAATDLRCLPCGLTRHPWPRNVRTSADGEQAAVIRCPPRLNDVRPYHDGTAAGRPRHWRSGATYTPPEVDLPSTGRRLTGAVARPAAAE